MGGARAPEGSGRTVLALEAWRRLARAEGDTPEGRRAAGRAEELEKVLAGTAYLGLRPAGETATVGSVEADGPAPSFEVTEADGRLRVAAPGVSATVSLDDGHVAFFDADDPQSGATDEATILAAADFNDYYDVIPQVGGGTIIVVARRNTTTSYSIFEVDDQGVTQQSATPARTCDGPIAVVYPEGVWYAGVTPELLERIVVEHLKGGRIVESAVFHRLGAP